MAKRKKTSEDQSQENTEGMSDADNFGLPEIDYKPLDSPQENVEEQTAESQPMAEEPSPSGYQEERPSEPVRSEPTRTYSYMAEEDSKSSASVVITIVVILVVAVAGFLIYQYVYKPSKEKERQELLAKQEAERKQREEQARLAKEREEEERRQREAAAAAAAQPKEGTIETLSERTRRYYVVISSAVDDDLLMDYARRLSASGVSTKIIPPFGKYKFFRLAIADYDTFANAQTNADIVKADYGSAVWVLRY